MNIVYIFIISTILLAVGLTIKTEEPMETAGQSQPVAEERVEAVVRPENRFAEESSGLESDTTVTKQTDSNIMTDNIANDNETIVTNEKDPVIDETSVKTMLVAGGCFWCVEADIEKLSGVVEVVSGYAGGNTDNPNYNNYDTGGHREVAEVTYDPAQVSYEDILIYALKHMDPTDGEGSFNDRGEYYAPAFYYQTEAERAIIEDLIAEVDEKGPYDKPLAVKVEAEPTFWPAEDYHQDYYKKTFSSLKYKYYRSASGRDDFINQYWGSDTGATLPWRSKENIMNNQTTNFWLTYQKPDLAEIKKILTPLQYEVTQEDSTERAFANPYDKHDEAGIYVDVLSGEPLYSSLDKYDSKTGWPSFVKPISDEAVTEHEDRKLFRTRTEIRSAIADNHLGHVFTDGPKDRGGLRYCMNSAALNFIPQAEMAERGYGDLLSQFE